MIHPTAAFFNQSLLSKIFAEEQVKFLADFFGICCLSDQIANSRALRSGQSIWDNLANLLLCSGLSQSVPQFENHTRPLVPTACPSSGPRLLPPSAQLYVRICRHFRQPPSIRPLPAWRYPSIGYKSHPQTSHFLTTVLYLFICG